MLIGAALIGALWAVNRGVQGSRSSGGYAVWILVPFVVAVCGVGVWLLIGVIRSTGFDLMR
ncbi:MAG TPA: hypothetical protein VGI30_04700 [Caulobacteraceae bacterium]|jgi:hypothetical protein